MGGDVWLEPNGGCDGCTRIALRVLLRATQRGASLGAPPPQPQTPPARAPATAPPQPAPGPELTQRMLEVLQRASDDMYVVCKLEGSSDAPVLRVAFASPNVIRVLDRAPEALVGHDLLETIHPDDRAALAAAAVAAASREEPLVVSHRRLSGDGGTVVCETAGCAAGDRLYMVCRDVRARKAAEAALRAFALATSHDLREPANSILVSAALLERRACICAAPDARFLLSAIRASCGLLLGIVTNVLTARQLEQGQLTLNTVLFDPAEVIEDVLQACRLGAFAAPRGGIAWERSGGDHLPPLVEADRDRLAQVLQNLVRRRSAAAAVLLRD